MLHSKFNLSFFEENIYTEFQPPYGKTLQVKALKTDAQGAGSLKSTLGVAKIKTCDYISINENKIFMIEITDLKRQEDGVEELLIALKNKLCPVDTNNQRFCVKSEALKIEKAFKAKDLIFSELRQKCIETTLLVHKIADRKNFLYTEKFKNKNFIIVIKEMTSSEAPAMQSLEVKLRSALTDIVDLVRVVPQDNLEGFLTKAANS